MRGRVPIRGSTAVALLALLLSFTGGARAIVNSITGADFRPHSITAADLRSRSVSTASLGAGAVRHGNLGAGQIQTDDVADGAVTNPKLARASVTTEKLGRVGAHALAPGSVTRGSLVAGSILGAKLRTHTIGVAGLAPREPITYVGHGAGPPWLSGGDPASSAFVSVLTHQGQAGFYKDNSGDVHLVGYYLGFTGSPSFVLPPGYRPPVDLTFGDRAVNAADVLEVGTNGQVMALTQAQTGAATAPLQVVNIVDLILLQGISWRPDQR